MVWRTGPGTGCLTGGHAAEVLQCPSGFLGVVILSPHAPAPPPPHPTKRARAHTSLHAVIPSTIASGVRRHDLHAGPAAIHDARLLLSPLQSLQVSDDTTRMRVLLPSMTPDYFAKVSVLNLGGFCPNLKELELLLEALVTLGDFGPKTLECVSARGATCCLR